MPSTTRRDFVRQLITSSAVLSAGSWLGGSGSAQTLRRAAPGRTIIDRNNYRSDLDRRLLGAFLEHLGRAVYTASTNPARRSRMKKDSARTSLRSEATRRPDHALSRWKFRLRLSLAGRRGPEGQAADRAGARLEFPRDQPICTNEFLVWCKLVGTEPLLGFNLGTATPEEAVAYVEYCNLEKGTKWSELRRQHGYEQPHNVRYWCMGNEMDGPWQMGHMTAREYGRKARDAARQIRVVDPDTRLIACGSSNTILPTYLEWDREVLEECYDQVDGISLHNYYGNTPALTATTRHAISR